MHLNFSLREPLVLDEPLEPETRRARRRAAVGHAAAHRRRTRREPGRRPAARAPGAPAPRDRGRPRGARSRASGAALAAFAERAAIPLLADPLSGARRGPAAVAHYDALLHDAGWALAHAPDLVLRVGDLPTSKPLRQWLHGSDDALQIAFDPEGAWQDPAGAVATILTADPRATLDAVARPAQAAPRQRVAGPLAACRPRRPRTRSRRRSRPPG